jgi:dTDP-4-dehydrorhamnose reductase
LGATGMLGHKLYQVLSRDFDVTGTIRGDYKDISKYDFFQPSKIIPHVDAMKTDRLDQVIAQAKPEVVINCIGVIKSLVEKVGIPATTWLNAQLPHELYRICRDKGIRLIHISTDCIFSGSRGNYREDEPSDAEDIYGKTKYLGEVKGAGALTIRTSIIGRELVGTNGLLEWFLANRGGRVQGYTNAIFSGFPTLHLAGIIADIITKHRDLNGIYHVASEPISKFNLLTLINNDFGLNIEIEKYPDYRVDRSLNGALFRQETGFKPLPWKKMVEEIAKDTTPYAKWRQDDFPR